MGRAALDLHIEPGEALVGEGDLEVARLGDDGRVGGEGLQYLLGARAAVLLVGDAGEDDVTAEATVRRRRARRRPSWPRYHPSCRRLRGRNILPSRIRGSRGLPVVAGEADRVEVAVEHERAPLPVPRAIATSEGRPGRFSRRCTSKPRAVSHSPQKSATTFSPAPPGTRSGIDGVDGDQPGQQEARARVLAGRRTAGGEGFSGSMRAFRQYWCRSEESGTGEMGRERGMVGTLPSAVSPARFTSGL